MKKRTAELVAFAFLKGSILAASVAVVASVWAGDPEPTSEQPTSEQPTKWFLDEGPKHWASYLQRFSGLEITVRCESDYTVPQPLHDKWATRVTISQDGRRALTETLVHSALGASGWSLQGANPQYSFRLVAKSADEPATREVKYVRPQNMKGATSADFVRTARRFAAAGLQLMDTRNQEDLPTLVAAEGFRVNRAKVTSEKGQRLLEVHFEYAAGSDRELPFVAGGVLLIEPDRGWLLRQADLRIQNLGGTIPTASCRIQQRLEQRADGLAVVTRREDVSYVNDIASPTFREVRTYEIVNAAPPDSLFTLQHYGFPQRGFGESIPGGQH